MGGTPKRHGVLPLGSVSVDSQPEPKYDRRNRLVGLDGRPTRIGAGEIHQPQWKELMRKTFHWCIKHLILTYLVISVTIILILNIIGVVHAR